MLPARIDRISETLLELTISAIAGILIWAGLTWVM